MLTREISRGLRDCDVNYNRRLSVEDMERVVKLHIAVAEKAFAGYGADLTAACRIEAVRAAYQEWIGKERNFPRAAEMLPYFQGNTHPVRKRKALPGETATPERPAASPLWPAMFSRARAGDNRAAAWVLRRLRELRRRETIPHTCDARAVLEIANSPMPDEDLVGCNPQILTVNFASAVGE